MPGKSEVQQNNTKNKEYLQRKKIWYNKKEKKGMSAKMKTNLKIILVLLISIMMICMLATTVKAEYSASVRITPDKTEVRPGDTINLTIEFYDMVDVNDTGANSMEGVVQYDTAFFDSIGGTGCELNPQTGKFNILGTTLTEDGVFATLQLKVSENATGTATVTFTDIITSDGGEGEELSEAPSADITLTFTVADDEEQPEDPNDGNDDEQDQENATDPENSVDPNNSVDSNGRNNTNSNGVSSRRLPNAGVGTGILIAVIALAVVSIGSYVLYKKYQKY